MTQFSDRRRRRKPPFNPGRLFANGEQGAWYDPSDFSTLYQDSAGTTPVTALGQPVGLMLDKSGNGNHASQSISTARPTVQARVNLLERTEEFDEQPPWNPVNVLITPNATTAPDGTNTGNALVADTANSYHNITSTAAASAGVATFSVYAKANGYNWLRLNFNGSDGQCFFDLENGVVGTAGSTASIESVGDGWYRCQMTASIASPYGVAINIASADGTTTFIGNDILGIYIWGAQLERGSTATTYQRVTTATDYADIGLPRYLEFDGTDDYMDVANAGLTRDKDYFIAFAGAKHNNTDAASYFFASTTSTGDARYFIGADMQASPATRWGVGARRLDADSYASVTGGTFDLGKHVHTAIRNWGAATGTRRVDGSQVASGSILTAGNTSDTDAARQTIGRFGNSAIRFGGYLYQIILRDTATSGALLDQTERFVARKTGVAELAPYDQGSFSWDSSTSSPGAV